MYFTSQRILKWYTCIKSISVFQNDYVVIWGESSWVMFVQYIHSIYSFYVCVYVNTASLVGSFLSSLALLEQEVRSPLSAKISIL